MNEILERLKEPFHPSRITWKPGSIRKDKTSAMALAYADLRAYQDRLDEICGMDWAVTYTPWGDKLICHVTINGITRSSTGEPTTEAERNEIDGTVAEAQAMKRACAQWGLGRYLYEMPTMWVDWDGSNSRFTEQAKARLNGMIAQHYDRWLKNRDNALMVDTKTGEILVSQQNGAGRAANKQPTNHTTTKRKTQQRPAQPAKANPVPEDVQFMSNDDEWTDMGREADTNERKAKAANVPFAWPSTDVGLEICAGYRETIADGDVQRMVDYLREKHQSSNAPLSTTNKDGTGAGQYGLLAGKLDYRYSKPAHSAILSAICGRVVNRENPPGWKIKELLDWVSDAETNATKVGILDQLAEGLKDELMQLEVQ